jgi:putative sterol carrier protein
MAAFLSDEWFSLVRDAAAALPAEPGTTGSVQYVVAGAPRGKVQFSLRVEDGRIVELAPGKSSTVDCTVQCSYADGRAIFEGTLPRDVAYMRGDLKVDGNYAGYVLRLMPWFDRASAALQSARARTEF